MRAQARFYTLLVLWAGVAFGAEGMLSGVVVGSEGEAIPGANVVLVSGLRCRAARLAQPLTKTGASAWKGCRPASISSTSRILAIGP